MVVVAAALVVLESVEAVESVVEDIVAGVVEAVVAPIVDVVAPDGGTKVVSVGKLKVSCSVQKINLYNTYFRLYFCFSKRNHLSITF